MPVSAALHDTIEPLYNYVVTYVYVRVLLKSNNIAVYSSSSTAQWIQNPRSRAAVNSYCLNFLNRLKHR